MASASPQPPHRPRPLVRLVGITLLVLLAHALLLGGAPSTLGLFAPGSAPQDPTINHFVTRSLPAPAPPEPTKPAVAPVRSAAPRAAPAPVATSPEAPSPVGEQAFSTTPAEAQPANSSAAAASEGAPAPAANEGSSKGVAEAPQPAASVASSPLPTPPALAQPVPPPPAPADQTQITRVALPTAVRLLFDGRGEERGFIKYAGSGEILWEPDGSQYKAKLEISTWGVRVRTWTSKGTLGPAGLEPLRFGDKPRGAELATHFQRDKNIISFSANNPDVPLQLGAQDKLSALLQLSAIVGGAPAQFGPGSSIQFQAADAHRAEPWHFKVGALEALDLPGGTLQGLKLSKAPTLEFDQAIEVWLAPSQQYLPVRLRITEANGDFVDLLWRESQKADGS